MGRQSGGTHRVAECAATADPRSDGLEGCQRCVEFLSAGSGAAPAAWSASRGSRSRRVAVSVSEGTTDAHSGLRNGLGLELESGDVEVGHARRHIGDEGLSV